MRYIQSFFDEKIHNATLLTGGLTNQVSLVELANNKKVIVKIGDNLSKEQNFLGFIANNITNHVYPKLLDIKEGGKVLLLEFKEGLNGKKIVDTIDENNWEIIGEQFGSILKELHSIPIKLNDKEKKKEIESMVHYVTLQPNVFSQSGYNKELDHVQNLMSDFHGDFSILHGDFSPHNCLFIKDSNDIVSISAVLDPSARVLYGIPYFDIVYLFNTRWNRNKGKVKEGFLKKYAIDLGDPLFVQLEKIMRMYLVEIYFSMGDTYSADNIIKEIGDIP